MTDYEARAGHAADFAEEAEALKIDTTNIVAVARARVDRGHVDVTVIYTTDAEDVERPTVYAVLLRRDADGVLVPVGEQRELPGFWDGADEAIKARLAERLGPPTNEKGDA